MTDLNQAHLDHRRSWSDFDYCYPTVSRRSKGVSLGVNLNPDKICNFDCVYCEVNRLTPPRRQDVDVDQLEQEISALLDLVANGKLFQAFPFSAVAPPQRRLNDIAFSGDGEPTLSRAFPEVVKRLAALRRARKLDSLKLVLITNATRLQAPEVVAAVDELMANGGEIWAKLDAGLESTYQTYNRTAVPYARILENLTFAVRRWPVFIQTLFQSWQGAEPTPAELAAYVAQIQALRAGGQIQALQLYTVARPTPEADSRPLPRAAMDALRQELHQALPGLPMEVFYGPEP